jgi:hypothetical protein
MNNQEYDYIINVNFLYTSRLNLRTVLLSFSLANDFPTAPLNITIRNI